MTPLCSSRLSGSSLPKAGRSPDMPRRQKKAPTPENSNDALTLLTLQQQVLQLTTARPTLDDVLKLVHETTLYNFTSAQDRRTLNTAQSCLDSLRIRLEAHANTVEETVKQRQVSLVLRQRQEQRKYQSCLQSCQPKGSLAYYSKRAPARASPLWMGLAA